MDRNPESRGKPQEPKKPDWIDQRIHMDDWDLIPETGYRRRRHFPRSEDDDDERVYVHVDDNPDEELFDRRER